jgi:hypothetical protein
MAPSLPAGWRMQWRYSRIGQFGPCGVTVGTLDLAHHMLQGLPGRARSSGKKSCACIAVVPS